MTDIQVFYKGDNIVQLKAVGHTDYAPLGEDIVCAGISTLIQTAILAVNKMYSIDITQCLEDGKIELKIPEQTEIQIIIKAILYGLKDIESGYPQNIKIKEIR